MLATSDTLTAISAAALCPSSTWSYLCCGAVFDTRGTSPSSPLTQPPSPTPPSPLPATLPFSLPQPSSSPLLATVTPPAATATPAAQLRCLQHHIIAICACRSAASPSLANVPSPLNALPLLDPAAQPLFPVTAPYVINLGRHYIRVVAQPLLRFSLNWLFDLPLLGVPPTASASSSFVSLARLILLTPPPCRPPE